MIDEKRSDQEIRELWAEHFPNRHHDLKSKTLCEVFRLVVEKCAAHSGADDEDLLFELHQVVDAFGIPPEEFYQVEKECSENA
jgi:hypothetical protein